MSSASVNTHPENNQGSENQEISPTIDVLNYKTIDPEKVFNPSFSTPRTPPEPRELNPRRFDTCVQTEQVGSKPWETVLRSQVVDSLWNVEELEKRKEREENLYRLKIEDYYPQNAVISRLKGIVQEILKYSNFSKYSTNQISAFLNNSLKTTMIEISSVFCFKLIVYSRGYSRMQLVGFYRKEDYKS